MRGRSIPDLTRDFVEAVALSSDSRHALSGADDCALRWWDLDSGACLHTLQGHTGRVWAVALISDGQKALSGSADGTLRWWDLQTGACLRTLQGHTARVSAVALSGDGRHGLSGSWDRTLRWWDLPTGRCRAVFPCENAVLAITLALDPVLRQPIVVAGLEDGQVQFFRIINP
jgi:WD40 repeat protein